MKNVPIRSYSGLHFPATWLNTERYSVSKHVFKKTRIAAALVDVLLKHKTWILLQSFMMQQICGCYQLPIPRNNWLQNEIRVIKRNPGWFCNSRTFEDVMVMLLSYSESRGFVKFLIIAIAIINIPIITIFRLEVDTCSLFGGWLNFCHFSANFTLLKMHMKCLKQQEIGPFEKKTWV